MTRRTEEQKREILARIDSDRSQGVRFEDALKSAGIQKSNYYVWRSEIKKATPVSSPKYTAARKVFRKKPTVLTRTETTQTPLRNTQTQVYVLMGDAQAVARALRELM